MHQSKRGKQTKHTAVPAELLALGLITLMWIAILTGAAANDHFPQQEATPQPTEEITEQTIEELQPTPSMAIIEETEPMMPEVPEPVIEEPQRVYYDCPFDQAMQDYIYDRMEQFGIDLDISWVLGMVWNESCFDQYAVGTADDSGYLQIIPGTFQYVYPKVVEAYPELNLPNDVFDPHTNLTCALYYMKIIADTDGLGEVNEGNIHHVLACYNRGPGGGWKYYRAQGTWVTNYSQRISDIKDVIIADGSTYNIWM